MALRLDVEDVNPYHTVYHEYVHMLMKLNLPWVPAWLNEGVAEFHNYSVIHER